MAKDNVRKLNIDEVYRIRAIGAFPIHRFWLVTPYRPVRAGGAPSSK
jgi:hypothetical protein